MTKVYEQVLTSFDMQGQAIKDVELVEAKLEDIGQTLPSASDYPNRVLMYNGEIVYSDGERWIGKQELVTMGLSIKDSTVEGIPNGKVEINGTLYTIYTLPTITNNLMANMPSRTIKANISEKEGNPQDVTLSEFATEMLNEGQLSVKVEEIGGNYVVKQGDNIVATLRIDRVIDSGETVKGFWNESRDVFTEDEENGTDRALRLTIKAASDEVDPTYIYLDTTDLFPIFGGDDTISPTIDVRVVDDTAKGIKRIVAKLKDNSVEERHLNASLTEKLNNLIYSAQIQADWNQTDATQKDFIKNKPTHLPSPNNSITTEQLQAGVVTNDKLANKTINFNGQTFELGAENQDLAPLKNTGFESFDTLPTTDNFEGRQVVHQGRTYTFHNGKYQSVADDLGGVEETREEQFTFQPTANDESVKDGLTVVKSIKGNTVVANQLLNVNINHANLTVDVTYSNGIFTINGISVGTGSVYLDNDYTLYKQGDKILMLYPHNKPNPYGTFVCLRSTNKFYNCPNNVDAYIVTITETEELRPAVLCIANQPYEGIQFSLQIINLTKMFGAGNEPTTVEEFERLYPNLPKEYNEGSLLNLNTDSIKSVGFNAYNGEYAKALGGMQYYLGGNITSLTFKKNLEDEGEVIEIPSSNLFIPTSNGYLFATGSDICINLSHSGYRNGEYEPYKESIVNLPIRRYFPDGMKSVGSVRDEIVLVKGGTKYEAIQRIASRAYQTGDEDLADVKTDKTNTYYILETPIEIIIDDYDLIDYEVSDFGTEEILSDESTTPIIADIQYGFNAVDEIRNHRFAINDLKAKTNALHSEVGNLRGNVLEVKQLAENNQTAIEEIQKDYLKTEDKNDVLGKITEVENSIPTELPPINDSVSTDKIQNGAILEEKIADSAVTTHKIDDLAVTTEKIAYGAIVGDNIAEGAVSKAHLSSNAVDTSNISDYAVTTEKITKGAVTGQKLADNSVTNDKIADNSISTSKIQDKAIIGSKIGDREITTDHIANGVITNEKLANRSIMLNGTPIPLGGIGQISGLVTANGNRSFLEIANNELILSKPTFAENGSIATIEEIVRYPLYTDLPTIGNGTITIKDSLNNDLGSFGLNDTSDKTITIRGVRQYVSDKLIGTTGTIKVNEHKCGTAPKVQAWIGGELTLMKVVNNGSGDLIWYSGVVLTEASCCRLIIEGDPDTRVRITI